MIYGEESAGSPLGLDRDGLQKANRLLEEEQRTICLNRVRCGVGFANRNCMRGGKRRVFICFFTWTWCAKHDMMARAEKDRFCSVA